MVVEETVGTALRCRPFFAAHKVSRPTLAKTATHRSGSLAPTLQNETRTRTDLSCASFAGALSCAKQPRTCPARAGPQSDTDPADSELANGTRESWAPRPGDC